MNVNINFILAILSIFIKFSYEEKLGIVLSNLLKESGSNTGNIKEEIYNGFNARPGQFPYQALLINYFDPNLTSFCGGSLISERYILTAGHCSYRTTKTKVILGVTDTQNAENIIYNTVTPANTYIHPNYNDKNFQNDIAILKLSQDVTLTDNIKTIALPRRSWSPPTTFDNWAVTASGWGMTTDNEEGVHRILQYRTIMKMPQRNCQKFYRNILTVTNEMICTVKTTSGPCQGDIGGPLTVKLRSDKLYQIGVVSWGYGKCSDKNPIVYVNVAAYLNWINRVTGIQIM